MLRWATDIVKVELFNNTCQKQQLLCIVIRIKSCSLPVKQNNSVFSTVALK